MITVESKPLARSRSNLEASLLDIGRTRATSTRDVFGSLRRIAFERLEGAGLPARKDEAFRFSSLGALTEQPVEVGLPTLEFSAKTLDVTAVRLTLVNGIPVPLTATPAGIHVTNLKTLTEHSRSTALLGGLLSDQDGFIAANTAGFADGWVIVVDDGVSVTVPVEIDFVQVSTGLSVAVLPRVLVVLGKNSHLELIERHSSCGEGTSLSNGVVELYVGDGATLVHTRWVELGDKAHNLSATAVSVGERATYHAWSLASAGRYVRHDLQVKLSGRGASATLDGLYYGRENQLVDNHVQVWHEKPEGTTKECYRGVIEDHGRAVFDGIIYVGKGAMKTDARQENRNLLLGPEAVVNTKPHLEIDADDVSCSHGATVGQLDDSQLFYLQARGIDESFGRQLLTWAFAKELVDRCPNLPTKDAVARRLEGHLVEGLEGVGQSC